MLCETVYYADGTRAGVTTPDDGYWTTRYIGSLIYEGEPGQETLEGVITDANCIFMQVDPMAEKYYGMTPYHYCLSSPLLFSDTDGQDAKVVVKRNRILVKSKIILFGQNSSYRTASQIKHRIATAWNDANKTIIDDKIVRFDIKVKHSKMNPSDANNGMTNYIDLVNDDERARIINSQYGTMSITSAAHEFGHIIGLKDRYDTVVKDGQRYSVPHDGYEGTIIAEPSGFGVVIPEDVQSAIKLCVPSGCKKGVFYINKSNSQIAKQYEE